VENAKRSLSWPFFSKTRVDNWGGDLLLFETLGYRSFFWGVTERYLRKVRHWSRWKDILWRL